MIRVRRNAVKRLRGCPSRERALTMQRSGSEEWRRKYGLRWMAESAFSWIKRVFGEYVTAKNLEDMVREITLKVFLYKHVHRNDKDSLRRKTSGQMQVGNRRNHKHLCNKALCNKTLKSGCANSTSMPEPWATGEL